MMPEQLDIIAQDEVEVEIRADGTVLWVHYQGISVLRICQISNLIITDNRTVAKSLPFEDDTRNPFDPNDIVPKPRVGDVIILKPSEHARSEGWPRRIVVEQVHDNLGESWDPTGEDAWTMHEVNDAAGFKGHWYAYGIDEGDRGDPYLVASYEVESVERRVD